MVRKIKALPKGEWKFTLLFLLFMNWLVERVSMMVEKGVPAKYLLDDETITEKE